MWTDARGSDTFDRPEGEFLDARFTLTCQAPVRLIAASAVALVSCSLEQRPENLEPVSSGGAYQAQYRDTRKDDPRSSAALNAAACRAPLGGAQRHRRSYASLGGEALSRGDLLDVRIVGDETFSHAYEVSQDGTVKLPFIGAIPAAGQNVGAIETIISERLIAQDFYETPPQISVLVRDFGSARVGVSGAVFEPHAVELGLKGDTMDERRQDAFGSSTEARNLSSALRAAGGVRPDADLSAVKVLRGGTAYTLDMRGAIDGTGYEDMMLISGDQVSVPSRGCFQEALMVPGPISPPGVSLFLSNLTSPATGNAVSSIGRESREMPYGTRFLQAVINANCVGGVLATSASRSAALLSRNPETRVSVVIARSVEDMMTRADRDNYDPYLLPGDGIACYDSAITNVTDVARSLSMIMGL